MNILYLFPRALYEAKMSGGRRWYGQAVARQPGVTLEVWGDGWDGYDQAATLQDNLERTGRQPDALWLYKAESLRGVAECAVPKFLTYNEACPHLPGRAMAEVIGCGADTVIHHHANDRDCFAGFGRVVHIPHGAPLEIFDTDRPHRERSTVCLSSGVSSPEIYPLRAKLAALVAEGAVPGRIRRHPGYRLPSIEACDRQALAYAEDLKDARVSLCCSSRYRYLLAKITESMLAGCLVVTDAPDDPAYRDLLRPHVVEVSADCSMDQLRDTLLYVLSEPQRMQEMALAGQQAVRQHLTADHYAARLVKEIRRTLQAKSA